MNMSEERGGDNNISRVELELYFLIVKFLESGPCSRAAEVLREEIQHHKLLPKRIDWKGEEHLSTYEDLVSCNNHITADHLLKICQRISPLLDKEIKPSVPGIVTLLGAGSHSLLRRPQDIQQTRWKLQDHVATVHQAALLPPRNTITPNYKLILHSRELNGASHRPHLIPAHMYTRMGMHARKLGHLSAVYCLTFDRTGEYIITGADDHLVKIWSTADGRLLATLRGHSAEITDMAVNYENTLIAAGSCDKIIRVWCLRSKAPVAILQGHTGMITSLQFSPQTRGDVRYLSSTGGDGCVCFWEWKASTNVFNMKPTKFIERSRAGAQMLCSSFSPGGMFLATGSSDHVVRVYCFMSTVPEKICELESHTDRVDSIQYSNSSIRFVSGSRDGTARIWRYERQEWRAIILTMSTKLPNAKTKKEDGKTMKYKVTMVGWNLDDSVVITAVNDYSLKVWDSYTGQLLHVLEGHEDEVFVLEQCPTDPRLSLSAGHDGNIILWNLITGKKIKSYFNMIEGQGHGAVFDTKFSPDGQVFAATDSHGHLLIFGFGSHDRHKRVPMEVFFHTDYRPLIRDANNYVLDEQTQQPPHLMPAPFLVDIDGNPYPPITQRLVPGREHCKDEQLVPQVAVNEEGDHEVIDPLPANEGEDGVEGNPRVERDWPNLDAMIVRLQREQDQRLAIQGPVQVTSPQPVARRVHHLIGMRRNGETIGVRQSLENISQVATRSEIIALSRRVVVHALHPYVAQSSEEIRLAHTEEEMKRFVVERKKKPLLSTDTTTVNNCLSTRRATNYSCRTRSNNNEETTCNRLTARALYDTEEEDGSSSGTELWDDSNSESSEYSDWMGDQGINLQPPKRSQRKTKKRRIPTYSDDDDGSDLVKAYNKPKRKAAQKKKGKGKKKRAEKNSSDEEENDNDNDDDDNDGIPEDFFPPKWLTDVYPRKAPYVPQMGDEVIYFRQGHEQYVHAVKKNNVYNVNPYKNQPWHKIPNLREQELMKIVGIKYEIRPPRLCCLKLAFIDPETGRANGGAFSIKYHDMPDVIDFLVLKQTYDNAMKHKWKSGHKFRSMIDDMWWMGCIESQEPFQSEFPDSMYQCFNVHWDNGETEKLSPWDMEPIDEGRVPTEVGGGVEVTGDERKSHYIPKNCEWPNNDRDNECDRIIKGLEYLMAHSIAEPFLTPVDLKAFPLYAKVIEYPIDLTTINERLENRFYRRVNSIQFDVRYVETNAERFNEPKSQIVRSAKILTETLLRYISDTDCYDPRPLLAELWGEDDQVSESEDDESSRDSTSRKRKQRANTASNKRRRAESQPTDPDAWKELTRDLLERIFECDDSEPFRAPVDPEEYPDYYEIVETPLDFGIVKMRLQNGEFETPHDLSKEVRLIFTNSKAYNTNKRSRIYAMTLRLSAMFDEQIREIISDWKAALKNSRSTANSSQKKKKTTKGPVKSEAGPSCRSRTAAAAAASSSNSNGPSTSGYQAPSSSGSSSSISTSRSARSSATPSSSGGSSSSSIGSSRLNGLASAGSTLRNSVLSSSSSSSCSSSSFSSSGSSSKGSNTKLNQKAAAVAAAAAMSQQDICITSSGRVVKKKTVIEPSSDESDVDDIHTVRSHTTASPRASAASKRRRKELDDDDEEDDVLSELEREIKKKKTKHKKEPSKKKSKKKKSDNHEPLTNGHAKPYRTRATTGSLKPRNYDKEDDTASQRHKSRVRQLALSPCSTTSSSSKKSSRTLRSICTTSLASTTSSTSSTSGSLESSTLSTTSSSSSSSSSGSDSDNSGSASDNDHRLRRSKRAATQRSTRATQNFYDAPTPERQPNRRLRKREDDSRFDGESSRQSSSQSPIMMTRNQGRRTVRYREDSDFEYGDGGGAGGGGGGGDGSGDDDSNTSNLSESGIVSHSRKGRLRRVAKRNRHNLVGD